MIKKFITTFDYNQKENRPFINFNKVDEIELKLEKNSYENEKAMVKFANEVCDSFEKAMDTEGFYKFECQTNEEDDEDIETIISANGFYVGNQYIVSPLPRIIFLAIVDAFIKTKYDIPQGKINQAFFQEEDEDQDCDWYCENIYEKTVMGVLKANRAALIDTIVENLKKLYKCD